MLFKGISESGGWLVADYATTWGYGYDFMLEAAQVLIDTDFGERLERVAVSMISGARDEELIDKVKRAGSILRECPETAEEHGTLTVAGISKIMESPVQVVFFNQTNIVRLFCPDKRLFDEHGERVFDNYMNSVEIKAHCALTERRVVERLKALMLRSDEKT